MSVQGTSKLNGIKVLIVEDEALIQMLIEDILADCGCEIAGTASTLSQVLKMLANPSLCFDAAILDVNLGADSTFPVAEILAQRRLPFVFATGSSAGDLPEAWRSRPTLQKPFVFDDVRRALVNLFAEEPQS